MKYVIDTENKTVIGPLSNLEKAADTFSFPVAKLIENASALARIETGLLPVQGSGLVSYRAAAEHEQIVIQLEPGIYTVKWGQRERDVNAQLFSLAMPYRIIIADFYKNEFLGSRHFFSMTPAYSWDLQLYVTGFSNTNNLGYADTSIGWICHYHNNAGKECKNLSEKIDYVIDRESGLGEPYNYNNMSETDGPKFYSKFMPTKTHFHNASHWANKTSKEGLDWVFDPSNFIPYSTIATDAFAAKEYVDPAQKGAKLYTLYDATHKQYIPYYPHRIPYAKELKPFNQSITDINPTPSLTSLLFTLKRDPVKFVPLLQQEEFGIDIASFEFSQKALQIKNILESKICPHCNKIFPQMEKFTSVLVGIDTVEKIVTESDMWCTHCVATSTAQIDIHGDTFPASTDILLWSEHYSLYFLPFDITECPGCGECQPNNIDTSDFFVYGLDFDNPIGCVNCLYSEDDEALYVWDPFIKKYFINELAVEVQTLQMLPDPQTLKISVCQALQLVHPTTAEHICNCGMYIDDPLSKCVSKKKEDNSLTCVTCVNKELISTGPQITEVVLDTKGKTIDE